MTSLIVTIEVLPNDVRKYTANQPLVPQDISPGAMSAGMKCYQDFILELIEADDIQEVDIENQVITITATSGDWSSVEKRLFDGLGRVFGFDEVGRLN